MSKRAANTLIVFVIGVTMVLLFSAMRGVFRAVDSSEVLKYLCDAFFVTAVLLGAVGILILSSNGGTFDMMFFGVKKLTASMFLSRARFEENRKVTFADYREKRQQNPRTYFHFLINGAFFLVVAIVILIIYNAA